MCIEQVDEEIERERERRADSKKKMAAAVGAHARASAAISRLNDSGSDLSCVFRACDRAKTEGEGA